MLRRGKSAGGRIIALLAVLVLVVVVAYLIYPALVMPDAAKEVFQQATDATTTGKVKSAFALSKRLSPYEISVDTKNDVVTLTGKVPSEIDKQMAESVARDISGVKQVDNQLQVEPGIQPSEASRRDVARVSDLEIAADLRERLAASKELKNQNIQISVQDRVVTLSGQVETPAMKSGAEQVARNISNVSSVVNNLSVTNQAAARSETTGQAEADRKDMDLSQQVSFALFKQRDNFADVGAIKVESRDGKVKLTGAVVSRAERALAEMIARQAQGVRDVINSLQITPIGTNQAAKGG